MADDKVLFVSDDVTLHSVQGSEQINGNTVYNVEAVTLGVGDTFNYDRLPPYQKEAVDAGKVPGVEVVSAKEAQEKQQARADFLQSLGVGSPDINFQAVGFTGPDADDGSFSDHLVSDAERVANHVARAEEEAGEAGTDGKVTVAGAESDTSFANAGKTTDPDVTDKVQGTGGEDSASTKESGKSKSKTDK